jgi:hypothetical protein
LDRGVDHVSETVSLDSILRHSMLEFTPLTGKIPTFRTHTQ